LKKFIVITTVQKPTKAIYAFTEKRNWEIVIVGDKKTPTDWYVPGKNIVFLSIEKQISLPFNIVHYLPFNHYYRKMVGYLYAIQEGADIIYDTDDDNIPLNNWDRCIENSFQFEGNFKVINNNGFINVYKYFTDKKIWPRGFPLDKILTINGNGIKESYQFSKIGIFQFLANYDPDVDAVYRLTIGELVFFEKKEPIVLDKGTICPFNSQNTLFRKELFPLLYLPAYVSFRFTDILRGLIAQPIMWNYGYRLAFAEAIVIQKRNAHDLIEDFTLEIPMYLNIKKVVQIAKSEVNPKKNILDNLINIYNGLYREGIVDKKELILLEAYLEDVSKLRGSSS
jgi:hypothetical protein